MEWDGQIPSAPWSGCNDRLLPCPVQLWGGTQQAQLASWRGAGPGSALMPGRRAEVALLQSAVLVEQPPWPFSFHARPCGWSSSGAGRSGCETQALHLLLHAGTGQGRAGSHRHFRECRAPSRCSCLGKAGRRLEEGCRPCWHCDSMGWAPSTQPLPQRWQQPQPMCWSSGKGLGDVCRVGGSCPHSGVG